MCGIAGFCNFKGDYEKNIKAMMHRMSHRGPDGSGIWYSPERNVVLGHQRLSIVDLSENGAQPMESESGRYVITYNGEIYNHKKLAGKLIEEGYVRGFRGTSDTEVLLQAIEAYGIEKALSLCKGMFAIALYDKKEKTLTLIRDRVGEKPLYYGFTGETFVFSSDIGSIMALDGFRNPINRSVLDTYFTYGYIPAPDSIFENIFKLEPGCYLTLKPPYNACTQQEYWSMKTAAKEGERNPFRGTREEAAGELKRLLLGSIREQMAADVPVGAFLSAGIDSSAVVALMQSLHKGKVKSFTIGMEEEGYNEAVYAKEIARHLGTDHTELYISDKDAQSVIPNLSYIYGEPFADSSQIPTYLVSKLTREQVTVSLSGDGGDELFCGYTSYASVERIWNKMKGIPYFIRKPCSLLGVKSKKAASDQVFAVKSKLLGAKGPSDLYTASYETDPLVRKISLSQGGEDHPFGTYPEGFLKEPNHNLMLMDMLMYHPDDILAKVDRAAMAVSLETRIPMLDKDVVEFAWKLPMGYKRNKEMGKLVLRDVLYEYVPREMFERPKKGFAIPIQKWLKMPYLREWAEALLNIKLLREQNVLNPEVVRGIWEDFIKKDIWRIQIWYILMFQQWMCSGACLGV